MVVTASSHVNLLVVIVHRILGSCSLAMVFMPILIAELIGEVFGGVWFRESK